MMDNRLLQKEEQDFLNTYHPKEYERPSVTTDIIIFRMIEHKLCVLLIKRGQFPFKNY